MLASVVLWTTLSITQEVAAQESQGMAVFTSGVADPTPATAVPAKGTLLGKPSRFMLNLKLGPIFGFYSSQIQAPIEVGPSLMLEFGIAVTPDHHGYLTFPISVSIFEGGSFLAIPVGFQYDIPLPVRGLYITPRASLGYTLEIVPSGPGYFGFSYVGFFHLGVFTPEVGIKYVFKGRWNFGFDPFSLPVFFNSDSAAVFYRFLFYGGVNF
jgi:hypothetical protein